MPKCRVYMRHTNAGVQHWCSLTEPNIEPKQVPTVYYRVEPFASFLFNSCAIWILLQFGIKKQKSKQHNSLVKSNAHFESDWLKNTTRYRALATTYSLCTQVKTDVGVFFSTFFPAQHRRAHACEYALIYSTHSQTAWSDWMHSKLTFQILYIKADFRKWTVVFELFNMLQ